MPEIMPATRNARRFYRHTFDLQYDGVGSTMLHTLVINPDDAAQDEPARVTVTPTLGGAYVTDFGTGLKTVTLSGTTGYQKRTSAEGVEVDGRTEFLLFRAEVYRRFIASNEPKLHLYWYNWEDDEYYEIQPQSFRLQRNKSEPLLYRYEFRFTCLRQLMKDKFTNLVEYLQANPSTRSMVTELGKSGSAINEIMSKLTGGS